MKCHFLIIVLCFVFAGCQIKGPKYVDADTAVKNLAKNGMYEKFSGMYIISRDPGGTVYFLGIDSLKLYPVVSYSEGEILLQDQEINYLRDTLELKYHLDSEAYIEKLKQKSAELIAFMLENGIKAFHGEFADKSGNKLELFLNNGDNIFLCKRDDKHKKNLYKYYELVKTIDSCWYVMKDKKKE